MKKSLFPEIHFHFNCIFVAERCITSASDQVMLFACVCRLFYLAGTDIIQSLSVKQSVALLMWSGTKEFVFTWFNIVKVLHVCMHAFKNPAVTGMYCSVRPLCEIPVWEKSWRQYTWSALAEICTLWDWVLSSLFLFWCQRNDQVRKSVPSKLSGLQVPKVH